MKDGLRVSTCGYAEATALLEAGHYLGGCDRAAAWFGLYLPGTDGEVVTLDGLLIGVAGFGQPSREGIVRSLWTEVDPIPLTYELQRFFVAEGIDRRNVGSWFLSRAVRALDRNVAMVVSYADPDSGHHGGLYQAAGWLYTGVTRSDPYHYEAKTADGTTQRIAKSTPWKLAERQRQRGEAVDARPVDGERRIAAERGWKKVRDTPKYRYVFPRSRFARRHLRFEVLPYPSPDRANVP